MLNLVFMAYLDPQIKSPPFSMPGHFTMDQYGLNDVWA